MKTTNIAGRTFAAIFTVLALTTGCWAFEQDVDSAEVISLPVARVATDSGNASDLIYGRVTTYGGVTYEGRLRWGGDEEAYWGNYFNGFKDVNPWVALLPPKHRPERRRTVGLFGLKIPLGEKQVDYGRPFMMRFGDIARIEAVGEGLDAALERGTEYSPDVRVTLKSGTVVDLDRFEAGDFDDGVRVWDPARGVVDLGPRQIRSIDLLPTPGLRNVPERLYGTVFTAQGTFTGFLQWDRQEVVGSDELVGHTRDGELGIRFDAIQSITRHSENSALVTLIDGRTIVLSDTRKVGRGNRGVYVDDPRYGRVLVSWDAFERVELKKAGSGPSYSEYQPGSPLTGTVVTRSGRRFEGRIVYDLDESETTETLDAPAQGVDYTIPFGMVESIVLLDRPGITLRNGEKLQLERSGDLGEHNAGLLIFVGGDPEYVSWSDVERIDFDGAVHETVGAR